MVTRGNEVPPPMPKIRLPPFLIMLLAVDSATGPHGDFEPRSFKLGDDHVAVLSILDRWMGQNEHYFKLQASDGAVYILRHNLVPDTWELTVFWAATQQ